MTRLHIVQLYYNLITGYIYINSEFTSLACVLYVYPYIKMPSMDRENQVKQFPSRYCLQNNIP